MNDTLSNLLLGFNNVLTPETLLWVGVGVIVGVVVGVLPGLGAIAGMVLLFPIAFSLDPLSGIAMLAAVYFGVMYGGTVGGILLNMPGTDQAIPATYEGYPLALRGRGGPALVMQAAASFVGGTLGVVLLTVLASYVSIATKNIGPPEFFLIVLLSLLILASVVGNEPLKGLIAVLAGFSLATVGQDVVSGQPRFTFGQMELITGIGFVPVTIGLFAVGEVLYGFYVGRHTTRRWVRDTGAPQAFWPSRAEWREGSASTLRGSLLGFIVGLIPGAGATVAANGGYALEKAVSRYRSRFGKGSMAGLASPSAADNAAASGSMLPTMAMGIPGSAATAILLGGLVVMGLQPGPLLMTRNPEVAWGVIASMYVANIMLTVVCIAAIPLFARIVRVPYYIIGPVVLVISVLGAYFSERTIFGVWVMLVAGLVGFLMKRFGYPPAAFVIAMVLAPLAENSLRQSLIVSGGSLSIFVGSPLGIALTALLIGVVGLLLATTAMKRARQRTLVASLGRLKKGDDDTEY